MKIRSLVHAMCLAAASLAGAGTAHAEPTMRLLIFASGGPVDFVARSFAAKFGEKIGATVVVEARPGANGMIAAKAAISSPPDGLTLLFSSSGLFTITPTLMKMSYDADKDLIPISRVVTPVSAMAVDANLPVNNIKEFVDYVKAAKTQVLFGSPGIGNVTQLWIEEFNAAAGVRLGIIPYKGVAPAITDILGGRIAGTMADLPAFISLMKEGKLKVLGIVGDERSPAAPEIPTIREQGFPGVDTLSWYGLFAPAGTPPELVAKLNKAVAETLADPDLQKNLRAMGMEPAPSSPEAFRKTILNDRARLAKIIKDNNIRIDQ